MERKTETIRNRYNRIAKFYDCIHALMEKGKMKEWRMDIWREVRGNVLEVGVGTGNNIPFYPDNIEITAIDFSEKMLEKAGEKVERYHKKVDLKVMDIQNLEFSAASFDFIVSTCVFCSVPDPVKGLGEIRRVLKSNGRLIMLEHVRSRNPVIGLLMDLHNPLMVRITGANINRNTVLNLQKAGLEVKAEQNLLLDIVKGLSCGQPSQFEKI